MSQVQISEVLDALCAKVRGVNDVKRYVDLANRLKAHGIAPTDGWVLVPIGDCPNCNNDGAYYDNHGNAHQCQWCDEMPHSRYRQYKTTLAAAPKPEDV